MMVAGSTKGFPGQSFTSSEFSLQANADIAFMHRSLTFLLEQIPINEIHILTMNRGNLEPV
jgi:hypothetical protein